MIYQYILFDLDGTLTDSSEGITKSVAYALQHFAIPTTDLQTLNKFIGSPLIDSFQQFYGMDPAQAQTAVNKYRERFSQTGIFENRVYPGVPELLSALKLQGKQLLVATSKPTVFAERILDHFNLRQYFDFVAGSGLDGTRPNKTAVIRYALEQQNIDLLRKTIMVGDRQYDMAAANQVGIDSLGVLYGFGTKTELQAAGANYLAADPAAAKNFLQL